MSKNNKSPEDKLLELTKEFPLLHTSSDVYITIPRKERKENLVVSSGAFRRYLKSAYRNEYDRFPSDISIKNVTDYLQDKAMERGSVEAYFRIGCVGDAIYYDLADGTCVEITKDGWSVKSITQNFFLQSGDQSQQKTPLARKGDINRLKPYLNIPEEDWVLFVPYLISCFEPNIQHPICCLNGSNGTGKSTLAALLKKLIDPSVSELETLNNSQENTVLRLHSSYYTAFDNL